MHGEWAEPGRIVKAGHKTGEYIAEVAEADGRRVLVQVLAVLRHPEQGDLHRPRDPDAPIFHERRASAYREKVWVPAAAIEPYDGAIPAYADSLATAWSVAKEELDRLRRWTEMSLTRLEELRKDYGC